MSLRVMIFEDEPPAAAQLERAVEGWPGGARVVGIAESVRQAVALLRGAPPPDVIIADIRLSDGLSFRVFESVPVDAPVIFATAYDEHVIAAMELNAIDYLLKPIEPGRVGQALDKYVRLGQHFGGRVLALARSFDVASTQIGKPAATRAVARAPERVLARKGAAIVAARTVDIAWFTSENKITVLVPHEGPRLIVDESLGALEARLDARRFLRLNRQFLVQVDAVAGFRASGKGRLAVTLRPPADDDVMVSQPLAAAFRAWLAG